VLPLNIISSALVTLLLVWQATTTIGRQRAEWTWADRALFIAGVVTAASALLCASYIKDEIISVAGVFYALAAFGAAQTLFAWTSRAERRLPAIVAVTLLMAVTAPLWAFRVAGTHFQLRLSAFDQRNEWAEVLRPSERDGWPRDPRQLRVTLRLKEEALAHRTVSPHFLPRWGEPYWVE
jgi:hypothetical protein